MANPNPPLENLKPWKKGQSGNPKGGAASRSIEKIFREFLFKTAKSKDGQTRERLEVLMARLFADGAQGSTKSTEVLLSYGFGKPKQTIEADVSIEKVDDKRKETALRAAERLLKD
jgi:hypothetical protein